MGTGRLVSRIVSGGQTGADRAALDWAIASGVLHGGWCPAGRVAEDGAIPDRYQLIEMPDGGGYRERTKANVRDSDATLIISVASDLSGGTHQTAEFAKYLRKPWIHIHPGKDWKPSIEAWFRSTPIQILNIAGPRASGQPEVGSFVHKVLDHARYFFDTAKLDRPG